MTSLFRHSLDSYSKWHANRSALRTLQRLNALELVEAVKSARLTYLNFSKIAQILRTIDEIKAQNIDGLYIEAGCALGGSAVLISKFKPTTTSFNVYDVFGMIPPPTEDDTAEVKERYKTIIEGNSAGIDGDMYYGYIADLYDVVVENLTSFGIDLNNDNVRLMKGLLQDTMVLEGPVAFAHIDVDWYDPVKVCLERIYPRLATGGSIILDDYFDWGGCRKAVNEFLDSRSQLLDIDKSFGNCKITKLA